MFNQVILALLAVAGILGTLKAGRILAGFMFGFDVISEKNMLISF
jgi:hypothetical protein